ncbi:MAG: GtrA family protein [Propionibacteriaceae bacterium]|nr:GtrA family protein [Propionibacteriaceae bacterium]
MEPRSARPISRLTTSDGLVATTTRFSLVGVVNTLIDFSVYSLVVLLGVPFFLANMISTSCGMAFSFFGNRSFTFRAGGQSARRQIVLFLIVTLTSQWAIQPLVIWGFTHITFDQTVFGHSPALVLGKIGALGCSFFWNFILYRKVVFKKQPDTGDARPPA